MLILDKFRGLAYAAGMRPKPGTILFSPTRDALRACDGLADAVAEEIRKTTAEIEKAASTMHTLATPILDLVKPEKVFLYETMNHCVVCGTKLDVYVIDIKECPNGHGKTWITHNQQGLPVITFEPAEEPED